ncbi:MAG: hypothetical protein IJ463_01060 [Bacilli bacterium]|nr:hypothetical protein [Bacilli bacterium]
MYKKGLFDSFTTKQLKDTLSLVCAFDGKDDLLMGIHYEIKRRELESQQSLNARFTMEMFKQYNMFYSDELKVLEINGIRNLQDLIEADLDSMIGMTESIKEKLSWARRFYNLEPTKDIQKTKKQL